jgi:hypothetical protein
VIQALSSGRVSSSSFSTAGMRNDSLAHAPKSIILQRSEQNGRHFDAGVHSTSLRQVGHATVRGGLIDWEL